MNRNLNEILNGDELESLLKGNINDRLPEKITNIFRDNKKKRDFFENLDIYLELKKERENEMEMNVQYSDVEEQYALSQSNVVNGSQAGGAFNRVVGLNVYNFMPIIIYHSIVVAPNDLRKLREINFRKQQDMRGAIYSGKSFHLALLNKWDVNFRDKAKSLVLQWKPDNGIELYQTDVNGNKEQNSVMIANNVLTCKKYGTDKCQDFVFKCFRDGNDPAACVESFNNNFTLNPDNIPTDENEKVHLFGKILKGLGIQLKLSNSNKFYYDEQDVETLGINDNSKKLFLKQCMQTVNIELDKILNKSDNPVSTRAGLANIPLKNIEIPAHLVGVPQIKVYNGMYGFSGMPLIGGGGNESDILKQNSKLIEIYNNELKKAGKKLGKNSQDKLSNLLNQYSGLVTLSSDLRTLLENIITVSAYVKSADLVDENLIKVVKTAHEEKLRQLKEKEKDLMSVHNSVNRKLSVPLIFPYQLMMARY
jgi:hypothetical protein